MSVARCACGRQEVALEGGAIGRTSGSDLRSVSEKGADRLKAAGSLTAATNRVLPREAILIRARLERFTRLR